MFGDPDPIEQAHHELMRALQEKNAVDMEAVAQRCPQSVQPHPQWQHSPFQRLAQNMYGWDCKPEHLACMDVLLHHGASPMTAHRYGHAPFQTLMEHGATRAFEHMHAQGHLARWVKDAPAAQVLGKLFTSTTWQHYSGDFPVEALTRVFLDAGAQLRSYDDKPVLHHLLWTAPPQYGFPRPKGLEAACALMLQADPDAQIEPTQLLQAWRANYRAVGPQLIQRHLAQGGSIEALQQYEGVARLNPKDQAEFQAWWLERLAEQPTAEIRGERRMRL